MNSSFLLNGRLNTTEAMGLKTWLNLIFICFNQLGNGGCTQKAECTSQDLHLSVL